MGIAGYTGTARQKSTIPGPPGAKRERGTWQHTQINLIAHQQDESFIIRYRVYFLNTLRNMQLNLEKTSENTLIRSVRDGEDGFEIHIGENTWNSSVILSPDGVSPWDVRNIAELTADHFTDLAVLDCEVLLLGTGNTLIFPAPTLTRPLVEKQKGLDVMDTAAACRTYNILLADGRSVAAALIINN